MNHQRILAAIQSELWAITPEALQQVVAIAQGFGDADAVAAKLGRPLTNTRTVTVRDGVAVVPVIGPIMRYANMFTEISGATSIQTLATDLQAAVDNQDIKAIILEIDSPGGQVAGVSEFAAQIRAANSVKPVAAYISNTGASAAYWIAAAAGEIVVNDTALIGSIGVIMQASLDDDESAIKFTSSQSPHKNASPDTDTGKAQYQKTVDDLAGVFVGAVADYRGQSADAVLANFGCGGVLIATDAIAAGMADRLGSLESLIAELSGSKSFKTSKGNKAMTITRESLASDHPDIAQAFIDDGFAAGLADGISQGATAERERITGIEALALPGHDALIAQFKADGKTSAAAAAMQILAAEKATRASMSQQILLDTPVPVPNAPAAFNDGNNDAIAADDYQAKWAEDAALRAEFGEYETFLAFAKADAAGRVRIKKG